MCGMPHQKSKNWFSFPLHRDYNAKQSFIFEVNR